MRTAYTWTAIFMVVAAATAGDVFLARAMREIGDLGELRKSRGLFAVIGQVLGSPRFMLAIGFMTIAFFSNLVALSWGDVSLVLPASASLTSVSNAAAAKLYLKEKVDRRRWIAAVFVAAGVVLLAH
jgi:drug/metabolite transporter (DMT)-like permease